MAKRSARWAAGRATRSRSRAAITTMGSARAFPPIGAARRKVDGGIGEEDLRFSRLCDGRSEAVRQSRRALRPGVEAPVPARQLGAVRGQQYLQQPTRRCATATAASRSLISPTGWSRSAARSASASANCSFPRRFFRRGGGQRAAAQTRPWPWRVRGLPRSPDRRRRGRPRLPTRVHFSGSRSL